MSRHRLPEARAFIDAISAHMQLISLLFVLYATLVSTLVYRKQGVRFAELLKRSALFGIAVFATVVGLTSAFVIRGSVGR